ncbi:LOW QUALITY PROTEIN: nardilysin [Bombina bombina]|uniref:LOW QUALITY PROTEIN: nardilysin n=1 Tax=Bombina bombina TaxID=8345 RepID=UPI00235AE82A|nr:LOW QUALITY PROTEIN: nardilysin [Bombina bombina]
MPARTPHAACPTSRTDTAPVREETELVAEDTDISKSPSDPKAYRFIQLENGLRALLISDLSSACQDQSDSSDEDAEWESEDESDDEEEDDDDEVDEEEEVTDDAYSKKGCTEKLSAAALCVGGRKFSDPEDLPGLAHFLEHMVFMGSEKYPDENGFDAFLKKHGGTDNASTDCERTIFQFDVQRKHFKEALDRWAQFFISPLMVRDTINREKWKLCDSEYQLAKPSDSNRKEMLFGSLAKPGHPMSKFFWGNAQTLKNDPKEQGIDIHARLKEFYRTFYSAHYMTLAVQSKETLDALEEWVREIFAEVPNNGVEKPDFSHLSEPFDTPEFHALYRVVPIKKVHALTITWALPPQEKYYKVKPLHYISWLIGHEGKGSILSLLRKKCWALALFGGNSETGFEQNTTYSVFSVSVTLTDAGYDHFYEVAYLVFQYLKMLQQLGPQERIFREIQKIEDNEFHYQEQTDPIDFVENICENMQLFPKEDFLTGDQLLFEYHPEVIADALKGLTPQNANLLLLSPANEGRCDQKEKWFGTQYSREDIDEKWKDLWASDFELNPELRLPNENQFIATDFTLKSSDCLDTEYPVKIADSELGCLWYKRDNKFRIPKAYIRFHLISPLIQQSPENLVLFDIFVNILAHTLAEPAYDADVAQLEYKLVAGEHGLVIKVKGFNHKLPLLFDLIIDYLANFTASHDVYEMITEQLKKTYFNLLIKTEKLGKDVRLLILEHNRWSMIEKYQTLLQGLTLERLMSFVVAFKSQLYAEGLVQGNFTSKESSEFLNTIIRKLQFMPLQTSVPVQFQVVELPSAHHLCKVKSLNKGDSNSEVTVYYQSGAKNLWDFTLMELLVMHMEEPCFDYLRTKQTLGYHVYPTCRNTSGILGFSVTVATQATKYNSEAVDKKIDDFLTCFGDKMEKLSEDAFKTQVKALIKLKECEDTHLGEEVDRNWSEVLTQQYLFDRLEHEIDALKKFTKQDLVVWFQDHRSSDRVLSVHVVGYGEKEPDVVLSPVPPGEPESSYGNISSLTFLPPSSLMADTAPITDIRGFTSTLSLLPYHKIIK